MSKHWVDYQFVGMPPSETPAPEGWAESFDAQVQILLLHGKPVEEVSVGKEGFGLIEWMTKTRLWPAKPPVVHATDVYVAAKINALITRAGPYAGGVKLAVKPAKWDHPNAGPHYNCPDPACCRCVCPSCMTTWQKAGRPTDRDCEAHVRRN